MTVASSTASVLAILASDDKSSVKPRSSALRNAPSTPRNALAHQIGERHRRERADQRRDAVGPDVVAGGVAGDGAHRLGRGRLQPVDADGLLVARLDARSGCRRSCRVSSICLLAWAKRLSSRSSGGMVKKPGSHATRQIRNRSASGRRRISSRAVLPMSLGPVPWGGRLYKAPASVGKGAKWRAETVRFP